MNRKVLLFALAMFFVAGSLLSQESKFVANIDDGQLEIVHSATMDKDFPILMFFPKSYSKTEKLFPVIYFLHGVNNETISENGLTNLYSPELGLSQFADIYQTIIVAPIVGNSFYLDAPQKSESNFATYVGEELPAFVDKNYRTIASREGRFLAGFSMGGYGAVSLLCRYPDNFSIAASRGGALDLAYAINDLDWDSVGENQIKLLGDYWSNQENYYLNSCFNLINHIRDRKDFGIIIEVGRDDFLYKTNYRFEERLKELNISHIYAEYPGGHYLDKTIINSLFSHIEYFKKDFRNK